MPVLLTIALAGCMNPKWVKGGATDMDFARDRAECQHEIPIAEANYNMALRSRGHSAAVTQVEADSAASSMFKASLMRLCLIARGYRQIDMEQVSAIQQYVPSPPAIDTAPLRLSRPEKIAWVRLVAQKNDCAPVDDITGADYAGDRASYRISCSDGRRLELACDFTSAIDELNEGVCRVLRPPID